MEAPYKSFLFRTTRKVAASSHRSSNVKGYGNTSDNILRDYRGWDCRVYTPNYNSTEDTKNKFHEKYPNYINRQYYYFTFYKSLSFRP